MTVYVPQLGDSLSTIAARELGDWRQWRTILEQNPSLNPLQSLPWDEQITLPDPNTLQSQVQPVLGEISSAIATGGQQVVSVLQTIESIIPGAAGYSKVAQEALAEVNGVLGQVSSALTQKGKNLGNGNRSYDGTPKLIDWLLTDTIDSTIA